MSDPRPIAVIDSGLGGLTLVRAIHRALPAEQIISFADTARLPYGSRTPETIIGFARQIARFIRQFDPKHVLIACNTISSVALDSLRGEFPDLSISGVIEPTARAAVEAAGARAQPLLAILATEATIRSKAYERALARRRSKATLLLRPAPLLVPIIEEGREASDPLVRLALRQYVHPLMARKIDVLILGCTHYGVYKNAIAQMVGGGVVVIDASQRCADDVTRRLRSARKLKEGGVGHLRSFVTDDPGRYRMLAEKMVGLTIDEPTHVPIDALPDAEPMRVRAAG